MEQQTAERVPWLDVQREMHRVRRVQLDQEVNLYLDGWRARKDAEERLVRQRLDEGALEGGVRIEREEEDEIGDREENWEEERDGEEEREDDIEGEWLARSRSEQLEWEERQWTEETCAEVRASSLGRRVSKSSSISFLDLSFPPC